MTGRTRPDPHIEMLAASQEQKSVLSNLLELYAHDFSEFIELEIGPDGRFAYQNLDLYWTDPNRFPFLLYVSGNLAGFLLVQSVSHGGATAWDLVEFFILRGYRRRSIGTSAAHAAFARFPGTWRVRVMQSNFPACAFWSRAVRAFAGKAMHVNRVRANGKEWTVYSFSSPPASRRK